MIRTCDIRFVMRDREREREPGRRPVSAPCPGPVIGWARSRVLTTCHTGGHLSAVYSCTVRCTAVQLSHQQHHYIPTPSVCQQLWKQPDVSYKVTRYDLSPVNNWHLIEIRIVAVNDIDEEFYLWISWQRQSSWHCKYLLTWKKNSCLKNIFCTENFWDEPCGHVSATHAPATFWCRVGFHLTQCLSQSDPDTKL